MSDLSSTLPKGKKTVLIVQARMGSTRLPGKVMRLLCGKPMLGHLLERLERVELVDLVVVATSSHPRDRCIEEISPFCWRGDEENVWQRFVDVVELTGAETLVRVTADCPLVDPRLIERSIEIFHRGTYDLVCVSPTRGFPRGLDVEVLSKECLLQQPMTPKVKEHVTWEIHKKGKNLYYLEPGVDYCYPWRLCVDEEKDWELIEELYQTLYRGEPIAWESVRELLIRDRVLAEKNKGVVQKV